MDFLDQLRAFRNSLQLQGGAAQDEVGGVLWLRVTQFAGRVARIHAIGTLRCLFQAIASH